TEGATHFMIRLATFGALLAYESGQAEVVLGTYVTNRNRECTQNMMGCFANLATVRLRCDVTRSFRDWLATVSGLVAEIQAHSELPYEQLAEELRKRRVMVPEIRAVVSSLARQKTLKLGNAEMTWMEGFREAMPWGFQLGFFNRSGNSRCRTAFDARIYDPCGVGSFVDRLLRLLDAVSIEPNRRMLELLTETARVAA